MKNLVIVDGYNFIFYFYPSKKFNNESLEYLRGKLIIDLINYKHQNDCDIILVFDGKKSQNLFKSSEVIDGIKVIYSEKNKSADSVIEKIAVSEQNDRKVFVVTSDYLQQKVVFGKNTFRKSSREFNLEIERSKAKTRGILEDSSSMVNRKFYSLEKRLKTKTREKIFNRVQDKKDTQEDS